MDYLPPHFYPPLGETLTIDTLSCHTFGQAIQRTRLCCLLIQIYTHFVYAYIYVSRVY